MLMRKRCLRQPAAHASTGQLRKTFTYSIAMELRQNVRPCTPTHPPELNRLKKEGTAKLNCSACASPDVVMLAEPCLILNIAGTANSPTLMRWAAAGNISPGTYEHKRARSYGM